jgi:hypothetical protein
MKKLRKLVGSQTGFNYIAQCIDLLPGGKTQSHIDIVKIQKTTARRVPGFEYEYFNPRVKSWEPITDQKYLNILNSHKMNLIKPKRLAPTPTPDTVFDLTLHFKERLLERFISNEESTTSIMTYVIENGVYIDHHEFPKDAKHDGFFLYEPDLRMLIVANLSESRKLTLITIWEPDTDWFELWLKGGNLKNQIPLKKFLKSMYE